MYGYVANEIEMLDRVLETTVVSACNVSILRKNRGGRGKIK